MSRSMDWWINDQMTNGWMDKWKGKIDGLINRHTYPYKNVAEK